MPNKHAMLSASYSSRWLACPPSAQLCAALPADFRPQRDLQRCLRQSQHHVLCVRYKDLSGHCLRFAERPEDSGW